MPDRIAEGVIILRIFMSLAEFRRFPCFRRVYQENQLMTEEPSHVGCGMFLALECDADTRHLVEHDIIEGYCFSLCKGIWHENISRPVRRQMPQLDLG